MKYNFGTNQIGKPTPKPLDIFSKILVGVYLAFLQYASSKVCVLNDTVVANVTCYFGLIGAVTVIFCQSFGVKPPDELQDVDKKASTDDTVKN